MTLLIIAMGEFHSQDRQKLPDFFAMAYPKALRWLLLYSTAISTTSQMLTVQSSSMQTRSFPSCKQTLLQHRTTFSNGTWYSINLLRNLDAQSECPETSDSLISSWSSPAGSQTQYEQHFNTRRKILGVDLDRSVKISNKKYKNGSTRSGFWRGVLGEPLTMSLESPP